MEDIRLQCLAMAQAYLQQLFMNDPSKTYGIGTVVKEAKNLEAYVLTGTVPPAPPSAVTEKV